MGVDEKICSEKGSRAGVGGWGKDKRLFGYFDAGPNYSTTQFSDSKEDGFQISRKSNKAETE